MAIRFLDYHLPERSVPVNELIAAESALDHAGIGARIRREAQDLDGVHASHLFGLNSGGALFQVNPDIGRLEREIVTRWNISNVRVESVLSTTAIFERLMRRGFAETGIAPDQVTHLIYCSHDQSMYDADEGCVPYMLMEQFGMTHCTNTLIFRDCASIMAALEYAEGLLATGRAEHCIVLCANIIEKMPRVLNFTVVGDGAGILMVSRTGDITVVDQRSASRGMHGRDAPRDVLQIARQGVRIIREALAATGLELADLSRIVTNNTNELVFREVYARLLDVAPERLVSGNARDGGHLGNVDMIRNLHGFLRERDEKPQNVLLYNSGGTDQYHSWNVAVLRIEARP